MKSNPIAYLLVATLLIATGCRREEPTTWNVDLLSPVAHGHITLDDIVADSLLYADENNLWHITLHEDLTDFDLDSLVALPDTLIEKVFDFGIIGGPFTLPYNFELVNEEENNLIKVNDVELKEVIAKSGLMRYKIKSYVNGYLDCTLDLPGVTLNGESIHINTVTSPAIEDTPYIHEGIIDLSDYHISLTGQSGFMHNRIHSHTIVKTAADAPQAAVVSGDDVVIVELEFIEPSVKYARGYFGEHLYQLNQTIAFGDDVQLPTGLLHLDGVTMDLNITNSVGADLSLRFEALDAYNSLYENNVSLNYAPLFDGINIERASDNNGAVESHSYSFSLNNLNSNIDQFAANLPDQLMLQAEVQVNPLGDVTDGNDFIYTDNALSADMQLDIPLALGMQDLKLTDTLAIGSALELEANGTLKLYVDNAFPFAASIQATLINQDGDQLETLIAPQHVAAAMQTSVEGETIVAHSVISIDASQQLIAGINATNMIVIIITLNTPEYPTLARLYKDYYMDFKLVANGTVQVSVE